MYWLRWHYHVKDIAGAKLLIDEYGFNTSGSWFQNILAVFNTSFSIILNERVHNKLCYEGMNTFHCSYRHQAAVVFCRLVSDLLQPALLDSDGLACNSITCNNKVKTRNQYASPPRGNAIPAGPLSNFFYKIRHGGGCPRYIASRWTSRLWL